MVAPEILKPLARESLQQKAEQAQELERRIEENEDMDEETLQLYEKQQAENKEREKLQKEELAKREAGARKGNLAYALVGIAFTILLALRGQELYGSGRGYFELFGIRLSSGAFTALIAVLVVYDLIALVSALRKK